jgi:hypothetical protein
MPHNANAANDLRTTPPTASPFQVHLDGVGLVHHSEDFQRALAEYHYYKRLSKKGQRECAHRIVTLFVRGEIACEFDPRNPRHCVGLLPCDS